MNTPALKNEDLFPDEAVLEKTLKNSYPAFEALTGLLHAEDVRIEWHYYRDGKAWMGKMMCKKKNLGWVHVYDGFFHTTFYFMERHGEALDALPLPDEVKKTFRQADPSARLRPLSIRTDRATLPEDILLLLRFKKKLK